jgi:conjugal transfer pilus assembly protein TraW
MRRSTFLPFLLLSLVLSSPISSKDFGVQGHTYPIAEPDLLQQLMRRLGQLDADGTLAHQNKRMAAEASQRLRHPAPVQGLTKTRTPRTFFVDPSIAVPVDLKDQDGNVFHKKGTRVNPLRYRSLTRALVFMDGDDAGQVEWAAQQTKAKGKAKIILTKGSPFDLMELWGRPVYFDQGGRLIAKLGIRHVPAVVSQEGLKLRIEEVVVPDHSERLL